MKATKLVSLSTLVVVLATTTIHANPRTANGVLAEAKQLTDQPVRVDVAFLRPVRWASPVEGLVFFHAMTYDKRNSAPGGEILLAAPEDQSAALAKKYGVTVESRRPSTTALSATLRSTSNDEDRGVFYLDLSDGKLAAALEERGDEIRQRLIGQRSGAGFNRGSQ